MSSTKFTIQKLFASKTSYSLRFILGFLFTIVIAALGTGLANLPITNRIGAMLCAILIAVLYRNILGYPEGLRPGIQFSAQKVLRFAIILYGFRLNINMILQQGIPLLLRDTLTIVIAISTTLLISKGLKGEKQLSLLLGIGTGVCGAAAIAAVAPIIKANEEDTAIGAGIIALVGTLFTLAYTLLYPYLHLTPIQYGIWSGVSLHEIAHVAAAAGPVGSDALAEALLAKLGRVFLLIPISLILTLWVRHNSKGNSETTQTASFPWFLIGFILTSLIGSYLPIPTRVLDSLTTLSSFLLVAAMVGLGLNVHLASLRSRALRPLVAMLIASVLVSIVSYFTLVL
ncbi:YeiH family protein [Desulfitobacterium metallireducens]|uniref:Membrane protein n=1 Tax=Desulfitobacterium metallireducens DSM 15288 TaxID=871968 RepID=W0EBK0_9FIRM|nr:putative sulfate exporter family transporter [Desulfitobacterium metallireducens]AHF06584.1 membrane protein [Desulfitobacterium metallireducens DSM 15288]